MRSSLQQSRSDPAELDPRELGRALRRALELEGFAGEVTDDLSRRVVFSTDNSVYQVIPRFIATALETADLGRLVRAVGSLERPLPMVARGGGTGTNGQSLTEDLLVDCSRLTGIQSVDAAARRAWVEPGVVLDQLNRRVAEHGLFFAPHVSTSSRATLGGMVSTDAAGKGSRIYGRTSDHVTALRVVTADGQEHELRSLTMAEAREMAGRGDALGRLYGALLDLLEPKLGLIESQWPRPQRGFSGYNLRGALAAGRLGNDSQATDSQGHGPLFDPVRLICGSEGTLALISGIEVRLTPKPEHKALVVVTYDDFITALRDLPTILEAEPAAVEAMDETVQGLSRQSPAWQAAADLLPSEPTDGGEGSSLFVELVDDDPERLRRRAAELEEETRSRLGRPVRDVTVVRDARAQAAVWTARKNAVGLLARTESPANDGLPGRPQAFVEDCAVPAEHLADFIAEFRAILDGEGLVYGIYGHADAGCVHVRPSLELGDAGLARQQLRRISDRVAELVARHGGVLWGEHGIGFRGEYAEARLGPEIHGLMRGVKEIFDPAGLFNPHKLYGSSVSALDAVPMRADRDAQVEVDDRVLFASAFRCNGNGACHNLEASAVMCPSFQATGDYRQSPKGRADLLREWLRLRSSAEAGSTTVEDQALVRDLRQSLAGCLSCKACTSRCPAEIDIPELKSIFLEEIHRTERRPLREHLMLGLETLGPWAVPWAKWINPLLRNGVSRRLAESIGLVDLPAFSSPSLSRRLKDRGDPLWTVDGLIRSAPNDDSRSPVVLMADPFTALFDAQALIATRDLIHLLGFRPVVVSLGPTGKFEHVKGFRRRFRRAAEQRLDDLKRLNAWSTSRGGGPAVMIEPSVALMFSQEYAELGERLPVWWLQDWLLKVLPDRLDRFRPIAPASESAQIFVHCSEKAARPTAGASWVEVLRLLGGPAKEVPAGCCGMAGVFGHELENADTARRLFDRSWREPLGRPNTISLATGFSCRCHSHSSTGRRPLYPAEYLVLHLKPLDSDSEKESRESSAKNFFML